MRPLLLFLALTTFAQANPEPDIPVHVHFDKDGTLTLRVEIDPRCFTEDPMRERYFMKVDLTHSTPAELQQVKDQTAAALAQWVQFQFEPDAKLTPAFTLSFTGQNQAPLVKADDPVVVTATWKFMRPAGMKSLRVRAAEEAKYALVVRYDVGGVEQKAYATLFPGEASFKMQAR